MSWKTSSSRSDMDMRSVSPDSNFLAASKGLMSKSLAAPLPSCTMHAS